jgi:hypothetical protein
MRLVAYITILVLLVLNVAAQEKSLPPTSDQDTDQYYVVAHFNCVDDGGHPNGSCVITGRANSCAAAATRVAALEKQLRDPCFRCPDGTVDNRRHGGGRVDCTQDGPCKGKACH